MDMGEARGLRLALAGGGTGGHIVPGRHLVAALLARSALAELVWFTAGRPIEERVLAGLADELGALPFERLALALEPPGGGAPSLLRLLRRSLPETLAARRALRRLRPDVVLALGGYTVLPVVLAAAWERLPIALLEINAVAGRATRTLAPVADRIFHAWRASLPAPGSSGAAQRHLHTGAPLGPAFQAPGQPADRAAARLELGFDPARALLVVLGGSQGALGLNRFLARQAAALVAGGLAVLHQVGPGRLAEAGPGIPGYRPVEYIDDVAGALRAATLVVCRGGASTLAEVAALGTPAIVVPYPHHADHHQERNALELGDGVLLQAEDGLDATTVVEWLELAGEAGRERRAAMRNALTQALPRDATERITSELLALGGIENR